MTAVVPIPDALTKLTDLVEAGDIPAARKAGRKLLDSADTRQLWLIDRIAKLLEDRPRAAVDILRHWWDTAPTDVDRAIIEACAPKNGEQRRPTQPSTDRAPRWNRRNTYQAPSTVTTRHNDAARTRRRTRQEQTDAAAVRRYQAERAGVAEGPQIPDRDDAAHADQVYASGFDYDEAAMPAPRGLLCLFCRVERARAEIPTARTDDGLCQNCRTPWRTGLPELPADHTRADMIHARCVWLVAHNPRPRGVLRAEWFALSDAEDRATVTAWVADRAARVTVCSDCQGAHDVRDGVCADCRPKATTPAPAAKQPPAPAPVTQPSPLTVGAQCDVCARKRPTRDGLCGDCRALDFDPA